MTIRSNRITSGALSSHWLEIYGENIAFESNNVTGAGWSSIDDPVAGRNTKRGFICRGNTFTDVTGQLRVPAIQFWNTPGVTVSDNTCDYSKAVGEGTKYSVVDVQSSPSAKVENNRVDFASPCDRDFAFLFFAIIGGRFAGNRVHFSAMSDDDISAPWNIGALQSCVLDGNRMNTDAVFTVTSRGPIGQPGSTGMAQYKHNGSAFVTTTAHTAVLNTPPGSPTNNLPYPVGDDAMGAWAQNPRSIATTADGGSTWSFSDILDVFVYRPSDAAWNTEHLPLSGSNGDTYLLMQAGWVDCHVCNNDFAHNNEIEGSIHTGIALTEPLARGAVWNSRFLNNIDQVVFGDNFLIQKGTIRTLPSFAVPATLNHEAGAVVPNANPSLNGIREWVCVSAGTPGTFHAVTIEDFKNKIVLEDDFIGPTLNSNKWTAITGSGASAAVQSAQLRGNCYIESANTNPGVTAADASGFVSSAQWRASNGGLVFEARAYIDDVTNVTAFLGFTDTTALERPTESNGTTGQTPAATDCVGFLFDTNHNTDEWLAVGVKAGSGTTPVTCGAPANSTFEDFRIEVDTSGHATFYIDGVEVAYVENAVTASTLMTPTVIVMERAVAAVRAMRVDYLRVEMWR